MNPETEWRTFTSMTWITICSDHHMLISYTYAMQASSPQVLRALIISQKEQEISYDTIESVFTSAVIVAVNMHSLDEIWPIIVFYSNIVIYTRWFFQRMMEFPVYISGFEISHTSQNVVVFNSLGQVTHIYIYIHIYICKIIVMDSNNDLSPYPKWF